jgi:hypothetical protein
MASTSLLELHKAVIDLNNGAVRLMEHKSYHCALDCLLTGIRLTKHIAHVRTTSSVAIEDRTQAKRLVEEADEMLLTTSRERELPCANSSASGGEALSIRSISTDYDPSNIYRTLSASFNNNTVKSPMIITDSAAADGVGDDWSDVDFHSSVLLYNFGVAQDCLAVPQRAYRIFELASQLVYRYVHLMQTSSSNNTSINVFTVGKVLQFKVYLSHSLIQSSEQLRVGSLSHLQALEDALRLIDSRESVIRTTAKDYASAA